MFFFEKKNQKTLGPLSRSLRRVRDSVAKVFASFFKKKRLLTSSRLVHEPAAPALRATAGGRHRLGAQPRLAHANRLAGQ
jgi:hypothetical protein